MNFLILRLSRVHILNYNGFGELFGLKQKCSVEVDDPPEARTWASKKYLFEVDDPPEARTWEIVFLNDFMSIRNFRFFVNRSDPEPF